MILFRNLKVFQTKNKLVICGSANQSADAQSQITNHKQQITNDKSQRFHENGA